MADDVWGQPGFTTLAANVGPSAMNLEHKFWVKTVGVDVDAQGNLWVVDPGNHRVMLFRNNGGVIAKQASLCLGQTDCNSALTAVMNLPVAVQVSSDGAKVYVLEGAKGTGLAGKGKVLRFKRNTTGGYDRLPDWFDDETLDNPRAMTLDGNDLWIADTGHERMRKFSAGDNVPSAVGVWNLIEAGTGVTFPGGVSQVVVFQGLGSFGIDTDDIVYGWHIRGARLGSAHYFPGVVRMSKVLPEAPALPKVKALLLNDGENQPDPTTLSSLHGMTHFGNQLFQADDLQIKVYNDPELKNGLQAPTFNLGAVGNGPRNVLVAGGGKLFVSAGNEIRIFQLPITANNQAPLKTLRSNENVRWIDDNTVVPFDTISYGTGMAYDATKDVLWVGDHPRSRVLRVKTPLGNAVVDLVLGQTSKTLGSPNAGLAQFATSKSVFDAVFTLALDNFGNLYVVDCSFEGTGGNQRVVRFDAAKLVPPPNNQIFFNPLLPADALFGKRSWQLVRWPNAPSETHWPNHPVNVVFDRDNHMYLLADGYGDFTRFELGQIGNASYERIFFYERPHLGVDAITPDKVIKVPFGQAAFGSFVGGAPDRFFVQDHTWGRIVQVAVQGVPNTLAPFLQDSGPNGIVSLEAEHYTNRKLQGGHDWTPSAQAGFSGDGALEATLNTGANVQTGITTGSPRLDFKVKFVKTGTHYVWIRGFGRKGNDDSCHAGVDGQVPTTADNIGNFPDSFTWKGTDMSALRTTINVATTGEHTVNIWMREDGFIVDKILLTTSSTYTPSGTDAPESPRPPAAVGTTVTLGPEADAHVRDGTNAGANFGTATLLEQKTSTVAGNHRRTFLRFGIGTVGSNVSSAILRLHGNSVTSAKLVGAYAASATWGETTITWNNAPLLGAKQGASKSVGTAAAYAEWDVTGYVQAQRTGGATAVAFEMKQDTANNEGPTTFSSREATSNRPRLVVTSSP